MPGGADRWGVGRLEDLLDVSRMEASFYEEWTVYRSMGPVFFVFVSGPLCSRGAIFAETGKYNNCFEDTAGDASRQQLKIQMVTGALS